MEWGAGAGGPPLKKFQGKALCGFNEYSFGAIEFAGHVPDIVFRGLIKILRPFVISITKLLSIRSLL